MISDLISSEESGDDEEIIVRPLRWRSSRVDTLSRSLDAESAKAKSPQAVQQTKVRVLGVYSSRSIPSGLPGWACTGTRA